ncbi:hypothetical protein C663_2985 [Bacillus subtilis XF-1]|nr:hypothetical protein C663_2985 [Bacillus subtilis XF-1]ASK25117.1 hypothetical protein BSSX_3252 [Bacillus subtilis]
MFLLSFVRSINSFCVLFFLLNRSHKPDTTKKLQSKAGD